MPSFSNQDNSENHNNHEIKIGGINENNQKEKKKPIIMEMQGSDKYRPNFTINHINVDGVEKVEFVFNVAEEKSAKDIDLDINESEIKLNSSNYELVEKFKNFKVNEESVKAKFSKKNGTLTLTLDKK